MKRKLSYSNILAQKSNPPEAKRVATRTNFHGDVRVDEYAWLRNAKDKSVQQYIVEENRYADATMRHTDKLQKTLYKEMKKRITENDLSVPVKNGPYFYYARMKKGEQHAIHCRKKIGTNKEEVILNENKLAKGKKFFILGASEVSPDHSLLAYSMDTRGDENYSLYIKNLETDFLLSEKIQSVGDVVWAEDGKHLFYTKEEHPFPPRKVYRHALGANPALDVLIYEEKNLQWAVSIDKSRSKEYIFIRCGNFNTTEEYFIPANKPTTAPHLIKRRKQKVQYYTTHHEEYFYLVSNERAVNYKILRTKISDFDTEKWHMLLPHKQGRSIQTLQSYKSFLVLDVREKGSEWVYVCNKDLNRRHKVPMPENEHSLNLWGALEYDSPFVRFTYDSFLTPPTVYDYHVTSKKLTVRKRQKAPGWHSKNYISERVWARNGKTLIPISLVHKRGLRRDGTAPLFLYAYGSYGVCIDPGFSYTYQSLLDRGWTIAIANPRGGGEMGWQWHKKAHHLTKKRTYSDFIACADYLVQQRYTSRDRLTIEGGSAGGMLIGAVLNKRSDLCRVAIAYVPAADLITSLLDTSIAGTRLHFDEIGNPRKKLDYFYIKSHSPYENIRAVDYPSLLVRASLHDIRTPFWEAAKWVARMRAKKTDRNLLLLKTEVSAGHFGKLGRYERIKKYAFDYAFLINQIRDWRAVDERPLKS